MARERPRAVALHLVAGAFALLSGCGSRHDTSVLRVVTPGDPAVLFKTGDDSIYPARLMRAATSEGLVAFDPQGRVVPALADRWIVLDGGQSYIFRLRDGTWSDGAPLTAASAQVALRAAIARLRGTAFGLDLAVIEDIRVMAGRVVEIRLSQPMPDLLQLLAQPELGLLRRDRGAGPMQLVRRGDVAELTPIAPERLGLPVVPQWAARTGALQLTAQEGTTALRRFAHGEAEVLVGGRMQQFPGIAQAGVAPGAVRLDPVIGLFGLAITNTNGFLSSAENREALAMAIDRDALVAAMGAQGWTATTRVVPARIENLPEAAPERWAGIAIADRQARARATVLRWMTSEPPPLHTRAAPAAPPPEPLPSGALPAQRLVPAAAPPQVRIALPPGPGADLLFARLRTDFAAIGVVAVRVDAQDKPDLTLVDVVARYARPAWFLNRFNCHVQHALCDSGTDALMDAVRVTADAPTRARLLAEAEASLTATNVFIPLAAPLRFALVSGDVGSDADAFATNPIGWHPLMPMALKPK